MPDFLSHYYEAAAYGLPQEWNADGQGGPERYIEAQVWDEPPIT